ncbi:MAG: ATP-dependent RecD-like DNA helicase, partial [Planctomycetota bacterium]
RIRGAWEFHRRHGRQFRAESFVTLRPSTLIGIERYLGSGMVRGMGKVMAARLVAHFGMKTLDVIEGEGERLTEVEGIGPKRRERILEAWAEQREIKDVMIFLQGHGISPAHAARIYRLHGSGAIAAVRENPYRLAREIEGIGFGTADRIARSLGIPATSPHRLEAGVLHLLRRFADDGHVFAPRELALSEVEALLDVEGPLVESALESLAMKGRIVLEEATQGTAVYLRRHFQWEVECAERLGALLATRARTVPIHGERAIAWFEAHQGIRLARRQRLGVLRALEGKALVITGGPGTGKTTIINAIIRILEMKACRILLAAPTGRAARRMQDASGRPARTLHRLLEFDPRDRSFQRHEDRPLEADLVILDEVSMVDLGLFHALLRALPRGARLVLVGDSDQLPSVGAGSVLRDLLRSGIMESVRLEEVFRQARQSEIVVNAHRVNCGEMPISTRSPDEGGDFFFVEQEDPQTILDRLKEMVSERIPRRFGVDPTDEIQVLSPMVRGLLGTANLNAELQRLLNPGREGPLRGGRLFRRGDRVMQVRNNYDLSVFNGDVGRIASVDGVEQRLVVRHEDREVRYGHRDLEDLTLSYACTVHKSQGSEFPVVVIPLHTQHYVMLRRNLLYTAITRGRRLVVIIGSRKAASIAVGSRPVEERHTRLAQRLRADRRQDGPHRTVEHDREREAWSENRAARKGDGRPEDEERDR